MLKFNIMVSSIIVAAMLVSLGCNDKKTASHAAENATPEISSLPLVYKTVDGVDLLCEIDLPKTEPLFPVVLYAHSWSGNLTQLKAYSQYMAQSGVAGVRINYRKLSEGTTFEDAKKDIEDAIEFIRCNADVYGFDMNRFGMAGASAGAVLTSLVAQQTPECKVYIAFNGGFDLLEAQASSFPGAAVLQSMFGEVSEKKLRQASAIYNIRDNPPDTLLFHGTADKTISCEQAKRFSQAVIDKGGKSKVELYEGREHGFFNANKPDYSDIRDKMQKYLHTAFELENKS